MADAGGDVSVDSGGGGAAHVVSGSAVVLSFLVLLTFVCSHSNGQSGTVVTESLAGVSLLMRVWWSRCMSALLTCAMCYHCGS